MTTERINQDDIAATIREALLAHPAAERFGFTFGYVGNLDYSRGTRNVRDSRAWYVFTNVRPNIHWTDFGGYSTKELPTLLEKINAGGLDAFVAAWSATWPASAHQMAGSAGTTPRSP